MNDKVAFVTGASRGIGKACALRLAKAGYKVAIAARTIEEGRGTVETPFSNDQRTLNVAGSIDATAAEIKSLGGEVLPLKLDVLKRETLSAAVAKTIDSWGRLDVLVNNAIYQGPGLMYRLLDATVEQLETAMLGNCINQFYLTQLVLPHMLEQGGGAVFNMASHAGINSPDQPADLGGWGFIHGATKGGFHRMAGIIKVEHAADGIRAYNLEPGFTMTEALRAVLGEQSAHDLLHMTTEPEVTADVLVWLLENDVEGKFNGADIDTPKFFNQNESGAGQ